MVRKYKKAEARHYPCNARVCNARSRTRARKKEGTRSHTFVLVKSVDRK